MIELRMGIRAFFNFFFSGVGLGSALEEVGGKAELLREIIGFYNFFTHYDFKVTALFFC